MPCSPSSFDHPSAARGRDAGLPSAADWRAAALAALTAGGMPEAAARVLLGVSARLATPGTPAPPDRNPWRVRIEHQRWQANVRRALADTNMTAAQIVAAYGPRPTR